MSVVVPADPTHLPKGYRTASAACGIKHNDILDISLVISETSASAAAVFTRNQVAAAPVLLSREHLRASGGVARGFLFSSGNANAATGEDGLAVARQMCETVAALIECSPSKILIAQTGLIGIPVPKEAALGGCTTLPRSLDHTRESWEGAARAMMTTDTYPKLASTTCELDGTEVKVLGIAKGAAMIAPSMATMLALVVTDASCTPALLQQIVAESCVESFHQVSIDGCMSTNDTVFLAANGASGATAITSAESPEYAALKAAVTSVARALAIEMARDAEGGSKLIHCRVEGATTRADAARAARQVVGSTLVKCAIAGECPYWGRVIAEIGACGVEIDQHRIAITFGPHTLCTNGVAAPFDQEVVAAYMKGKEIEITVDLNLGPASGEAFGSDLTHEYLQINMEKS